MGTNPLARNWYLQEMNVVRDGKMQATVAKDHLIDTLLKTMETRIDPVRALTDYAGYKILFKIDDVSYHYHVRNGVMIRSLDALKNHDTGIICSGSTFKDMLTNKGALVINFVTGQYEMIGSATNFLKF